MALLVATTTVGGIACGGEDDGFTIADLCDESDGAFIAIARKRAECSPQVSLFQGGTPSDVDLSASCVAHYASFVEDGTIGFSDKSLLDACLAAVETAACETFELAAIPECAALAVGTLTEGSACESDDQCQGDAYCDQLEPTTCGTCTEQFADGSTCSQNRQCASGRCHGDYSCGPFSYEGEGCVVSDDCAGQLACDGMSCKPFSVFAVGDSCVVFADCGYPLSKHYCDMNTQECAAFLDLGADCSGEAICNWVAAEICDPETLLCVAPTIAGLGESCGLVQGRKCAAGLSCNGGNPAVCIAQGLGDPCVTIGSAHTCRFLLECGSDGFCDYETSNTGMCSQ